MAAAEYWYRFPIYWNKKRRAEEIVERVKKYNLDGIMFGVWCFDRWFGAHDYMVYKKLQEEQDIPCMLLDLDAFDDRDISPETIRTRLETFAEILKARKKR